MSSLTWATPEREERCISSKEVSKRVVFPFLLNKTKITTIESIDQDDPLDFYLDTKCSIDDFFEESTGQYYAVQTRCRYEPRPFNDFTIRESEADRICRALDSGSEEYPDYFLITWLRNKREVKTLCMVETVFLIDHAIRCYRGSKFEKFCGCTHHCCRNDDPVKVNSDDGTLFLPVSWDCLLNDPNRGNSIKLLFRNDKFEIL